MQNIETLLSELAVILADIDKAEAAVQKYIAGRYPQLGEWKSRAAELQKEAEALVPSVEMPEGKRSTVLCGFQIGQRKGKDKWELSRPEDQVIATLREFNCGAYIREKFEINLAQLGVNPLPEETAEKCGLRFVAGEDKPFVRKVKTT